MNEQYFSYNGDTKTAAQRLGVESMAVEKIVVA